jgi:hypothetical protein
VLTKKGKKEKIRKAKKLLTKKEKNLNVNEKTKKKKLEC